MLEVCKWESNASETKWRQLEEVDCFKHMGSQVAAGGGCERNVAPRMNEGYQAWGSLIKCDEK